MNEHILLEARNIIAGFLKSRRKELNMTQEELAEKSGMGLATIKRIESGKFWINLKQYLILCHHLRLLHFLETVESKNEMVKLLRSRYKRDGDEN